MRVCLTYYLSVLFTESLFWILCVFYTSHCVVVHRMSQYAFYWSVHSVYWSLVLFLVIAWLHGAFLTLLRESIGFVMCLWSPFVRCCVLWRKSWGSSADMAVFLCVCELTLWECWLVCAFFELALWVRALCSLFVRFYMRHLSFCAFVYPALWVVDLVVVLSFVLFVS